jgi:Family of unknown function (DUF6011)
MSAKIAGSRAGNRYGNNFKVQYLSPAQSRFIQRLLNERIHTLDISDVTKINKKHASRIIDELLKCPKKIADKVSDKQISYIDLLLKTRQEADKHCDLWLNNFKKKSIYELERDQAKTLIDSLVRLQKIEVAVTIDVGAYEHDGVLYSVRRSRESNKLHAYTYNSETKCWEFARGAVYNIKPEDRLTLSRASQLSVMVNSCVHCGRTLTLRKSVVAGMGRVCASKYH